MMTMDPYLRSQLEAIFQQGQVNDAQQIPHQQRLLNLEPETAQFISFLVRSTGRARILEIGTSNGYSTIWLAWSARQTNGRVLSIDREPQKQKQADANLRRAGLRNLVELRCGDATSIVTELSGPFDCVFFDADRLSAPAQLALLLPILTPNALLLADNVLSHPQEIAEYLAAINALQDFEHMIIPLGKGLSVAYREQ
jgi:predicted O-methyltransferase YrrM